MSSFFLLALSASAALLGNAPVNTCREHSRASAIMQANRRSVLAAAACLALPTKAAWAGYALGAAAVAEHSTIATGKAKEKAVYDSVRSSIDAKRPDRPDLGTRAPAPYPQPYSPTALPAQLLPLLSRAHAPPFPVAQWATLAESTPRSHRAAASSSSSSWPFRIHRRLEPTRVPRICWVGPRA